jgi:plasmid stability protein
MANLTISVDDLVLERARARALRLGTSVNAVLRDRLTEFAGDETERKRALSRLAALAARSKGRSRGQRWTREEIHER